MTRDNIFENNSNNHQISKLLTLPVFPILPAGDRRSKGAIPSFGAARSPCYFVDSSVLLIPDLKDVTFIEVKSCPELVAVVQLEDQVKNEVNVLELVLEYADQWSQQLQPVSKGLLDRLFNRISDLPPQSRDRLYKLPFVDVGDGRVRPPCEVVDPESRIAKLFSPSDQVLPVGRFSNQGPDTILTQLRSRGLLQAELSSAIIDERLRNMDQSNTTELLKVVDGHYLSQTTIPDDFLPPTIFSTLWMPVPGAQCYVHKCRDQQAPERWLLYDLVTPVVDYRVKSTKLRSTLGWDVIHTETIIKQMEKVIESYSTSEGHSKLRVTTLIIELADRMDKQTCTMTDLEGLRQFLQARPWIPMANSTLELAERCFLDSIDLDPLSRFRQLPFPFLEDQKVEAFLKQFGVCQRPSMAVLLSELEYLRQSAGPLVTTERLIRSSVAILMELSTRDLASKGDREKIWVPIVMESDSPGLFQSINTVCYNNLLGSGHPPPHEMFFVHPAISQELADRLCIDRLSDLEIGPIQEDDFESFDVGEDLTRRIQNVLKAYKEDASSNEWVANADDVGAPKVSFICSEQHFKIHRVPSPSLVPYFEGPFLIVYNSAKFSEEDFKGLQRVGLGGKSGKPNSIGRFGLGVLSFYHFGDIVTLVSDRSVVFLDPSGENLPRKLGSGKRSGMKMTITECRRVFPDAFLAIESVEGFNSSEDRYNGTIFLVPLRSEAQSRTSKVSTTSISVQSVIDRVSGAFLANAKRSLFFTGVSSVQAYHRLLSGVTNSLWSVEAERGDAKESDGMRHRQMKLTVSEPSQGAITPMSESSEWLLTFRVERLPSEFEALSTKNRLSAMITAALAVQILPPPTVPSSHLLFSALPLPLDTKINAHIHSQC